MIVRGLDRQQIEEAAATLGLELDNLRPQGRGFAFRLIPQSSRARFSRRSGAGRRLRATCYHGFRDFHRACWREGATSINTSGPGGRVTYRDAAQFEHDLPAYRAMNVGSMMAPAPMISLCECVPDNDQGVTMLKQATMRACQFAIMMPEHYRSDDTCRCDDPDHRAMMIREWEYTAADFS